MSETDPNNKTEARALLRPAFDTNAQALAFLALIVFALVLPVLITKSGLITRRDSYRIMHENQGAFSFVENEIFDNDRNIDILFLGSSAIFGDIHTPLVQKELSNTLGRQARVLTFGHYFNGVDIPYSQMRDLLSRKRVGMVVISVPRIPFPDGPIPTVYKFIRYSDDRELFDKLPLQSKISIYACSVLRSPHDLLTVVRENRSTPSPFAQTLGADIAELGMGRMPEKFVKFSPPPPSVPVDSLFYSEQTQDQFRFTNDEISTHHFIYLKSLIALLEQNNIPVAVINLPMLSERHSSQVVERKDWSKIFGKKIPMIGIPPAVLFNGLKENETENLFYDDIHMNSNGSEFFTRAVTPAILEVYQQNAKKDR